MLLYILVPGRVSCPLKGPRNSTQFQKPFNAQEIPAGTRLHKTGKNTTQTCNLSENPLLTLGWLKKRFLGKVNLPTWIGVPFRVQKTFFFWSRPN